MPGRTRSQAFNSFFLRMSSPNAVLEPAAENTDKGGICFRPFDQSGTFRLADNQKVRRLAMRGAGATTVAQGVGVAIQIVSTLVLARLLMPADFGLVTMVT